MKKILSLTFLFTLLFFLVACNQNEINNPILKDENEKINYTFKSQDVNLDFEIIDNNTFNKNYFYNKVQLDKNNILPIDLSFLFYKNYKYNINEKFIFEDFIIKKHLSFKEENDDKIFKKIYLNNNFISKGEIKYLFLNKNNNITKDNYYETLIESSYYGYNIAIPWQYNELKELREITRYYTNNDPDNTVYQKQFNIVSTTIFNFNNKYQAKRNYENTLNIVKNLFYLPNDEKVFSLIQYKNILTKNNNKINLVLYFSYTGENLKQIKSYITALKRNLIFLNNIDNHFKSINTYINIDNSIFGIKK